ncbi:MAG: YjbE family putative metal transport protein [Gammaproteobacteria bacterium]|nr:YjbE family putative metal transport protein [Gammaproteobacteria bacterium]
MDLVTLWPELVAFGQVVLIDLVLAGDNAIVVAMAAAGLPAAYRQRVIVIGIAAATVARVLFALATNFLLQIIGLMLAGGLLLLWVCWKFWRELVHQRRKRLFEAHHQHQPLSTEDNAELARPQAPLPGVQVKTFGQAVTQIVIADVSMSLDNVLAVAGAAAEHTWVLVFGLILSVALMGAAATIIARLLNRHPWIAYVGLAMILWVALDMVYRGSVEVLAATLT